MSTVHEAAAGYGHPHRSPRRLARSLTLAAIACAGIAAAWLTHVQKLPAPMKSVPSLVIVADCGGCAWNTVLARRIAVNYVRRSLEAGYGIDSGSPVRAVVERFDPHTSDIAVRVWFDDGTVYVTSDPAYPNAGAALAALGRRLADAIAAEKAARSKQRNPRVGQPAP
jgi:hypothetical protein